ncbi:hypothetical protein F4805DRAFT_460812 [Annulohypoxylon moriforme]|nr:hypothetical protein F4805DRAFT_460812 [Annulohypoxylon moriforme]
MNPLPLISLPTEIISQICDILYLTHPSSLLNFAKSSKACYTVATTFLFRTIWIFAAEPEDFNTIIQEHLKRLHRFGTFGCVHCLVIYGPGVDNPSREKSSDYPTPVPVVDLQGRFNNPQPSVYRLDRSPVAKVYETNNRWLPLAELVRQLPALTDLIYQCPGQFPPCLLQALHQHRPECRLHIDNFFLRSLVAEPPIADPHEFMIATSPCLYSINIAADYVNNSVPSHHVGAVLRLVTGLAPNLKEVHLFRNKRWRWDDHQEDASFTPPWGNLPISKACPKAFGSLSCLQLWGPAEEPSIIRGSVLADWGMHTDFTVLRTLRLNGLVCDDALDNLVYGSHNFQSLETLVLTLSKPWQLYMMPSGRICPLTEKLICNLQTLHTLEIIGWSKDMKISTKLSPKLRTLKLQSCYDEYPTVQDITHIRQRCPMIENLEIAVLRTKGDASEVALYKELGTFPKLKKLVLDMHAPFHSIQPEPYFDDFDREPLTGFKRMKGHVRDVFINNAMDDALVQAIFETVSGVKECHNFAPLERLRIEFGGGRELSFGIKFLILGKFGIPFFSTWQVDRSPRDDSRQTLLVRRLDKGDRKSKESQHDEFRKMFFGMPHVTSSPNEVESIFRRIWPERWEGSDWYDDWHSFPLSTSIS